MTASEVVVDSYRRRARLYRAETAEVRRPQLLQGLLDTTRHVAEIPCGTGHFLPEYAQASVVVTLVDACQDMLDVATEHACDVGLAANRVHARLSTVQQLPLLDDVDLVVMPNGALNQLARQTAPTRLLAGLGSVMRPGSEVLAQVACIHPGDGIDTATFYDSQHQHAVWFADRLLHSGQADGAVLRRRRQYRDGTHLRIEFDYHNVAGERLHTTVVELALLPATELADEFNRAGFHHVRFLPGRDGLSELVATTPLRGQR